MSLVNMALQSVDCMRIIIQGCKVLSMADEQNTHVREMYLYSVEPVKTCSTFFFWKNKLERENNIRFSSATDHDIAEFGNDS